MPREDSANAVRSFWLARTGMPASSGSWPAGWPRPIIVPTIVISLDGAVAQGSARSIAGFDLYQAI